MLKPVGALTGHAERLGLLPEQFSVSSNLFTLFLPGHDCSFWHDCSSILQLEGSGMFCCSPLCLRKSLLALQCSSFHAIAVHLVSSSPRARASLLLELYGTYRRQEWAGICPAEVTQGCTCGTFSSVLKCAPGPCRA